MLARVTHARIARPLAVDHPPRTAHHLAACALALTLMVAPGLGCGGGEPTSAGAGETGGEDVAETGSETATSSTPGADADSDGLPDHLDRCATERGEARAGGCPPYDADQDGSPEAWSEFTCAARTCSQSYCIREAPPMPVLYFVRGRAAGQTADIPALARALGGEGDVYVSGHTGEGEAAELGRSRAEWVIARLAQQGVDTARLQAVGFGSHWGKVDPPSGMSPADADRRVEVIATWYGPPGCTAHAVPVDKCPVACTP